MTSQQVNIIVIILISNLLVNYYHYNFMHVGSDNGVCPRDQDKQDKSFGWAGCRSQKVNPISCLSSWWNSVRMWPSTLMHLRWKDNLLVTTDDSSAMFCRLGRYAVESYLEQILSHGFFHADPVSSYCCFWFLVLYNIESLGFNLEWSFFPCCFEQILSSALFHGLFQSNSHDREFLLEFPVHRLTQVY